MASKLHAVPSDVGPPALAEPLSFELLYAEHFEFSWRVLHHLGLNGAALNDGCQELWLAVHRRLPTLELRCELRTWLFGIAINVARNHRRSEVRRGAVHELSVQLPCPGPDPEAQHSARETWSSVQDFLETLSEADRWIFVCNVVERLSAAETARALRIDVSTVYQRVRALKRAVQKWLDR